MRLITQPNRYLKHCCPYLFRSQNDLLEASLHKQKQPFLRRHRNNSEASKKSNCGQFSYINRDLSSSICTHKGEFYPSLLKGPWTRTKSMTKMYFKNNFEACIFINFFVVVVVLSNTKTCVKEVWKKFLFKSISGSTSLW